MAMPRDRRSPRNRPPGPIASSNTSTRIWSPRCAAAGIASITKAMEASWIISLLPRMGAAKTYRMITPTEVATSRTTSAAEESMLRRRTAHSTGVEWANPRDASAASWSIILQGFDVGPSIQPARICLGDYLFHHSRRDFVKSRCFLRRKRDLFLAIGGDKICHRLVGNCEPGGIAVDGSFTASLKHNFLLLS